MKTAHELQKEINHLVEYCSGAETIDAKDLKRMRKRVEYLNPLLKYLETNPTKEFVAAELNRTEDLLRSINSKFCPPDTATGNAITILKKSFDQEWNVPKLKTQIKNLKYLLNE